MPLLLSQPASGPYSATFNAVDVGLTVDGYKLRTRAFGQNINRSDTYGDAPLDYVYRGGQMRALFTCQDFKTTNLAIFWPFGTWLQMMTAALPVGLLATDLAQSLVLTATANTPAVAAATGKNIINTLTASKCTLPTDAESEIFFDSRLREIPIELQVWPQTSGGNVVFATTT